MNKITRKLLAAVACLGLAGALLATPGCTSDRLAGGGVYTTASTNADGTITATADIALYRVDATFKMAVSSMDTAFNYERDNRAALWSISHDIKHTFDLIRPKAVDAKKRYAAFRAVYVALPADQRTTKDLEGIVTEIQTLLASVSAAIAVKTGN